jgi:hypothetical protein
MKMNDKVAARDRQLKIELELSKSNGEEMMSKLLTHQLLIKELNELVFNEKLKAVGYLEIVRVKVPYLPV